MVDDVSKLIAREEIRDLINRWCRAIDRLDLNAINEESLVETYCIAMQKYPTESRSALEALVGKLDIAQGLALDMTIACRYVNIVTRRDGVWRIANRTVVFASVSVVPGIAIPNPEKTGWVSGKRGGLGEDRDLIYRHLLRAK